MSLRSVNCNPTYNSRDDDIVRDFYTPCFQQAVNYDRAAGYFTSNILLALSQGLQHFIAHEGTMRLLCSPCFNEDDLLAITGGYEQRATIIERCLNREVVALPSGLTNNGLNLLSWLIAHQKLEIKIAVPIRITKEDYGIYHEKLGIFRDRDGDRIAFFGSNNETLAGVRQNYESFDVYRSWAESERCEIKTTHFNRLWTGQAKGLEIYAFPEAVAAKLITHVRPECNYVRENASPWPAIPEPTKTATAVFLHNLWNFQTEAISAFKNNNCRGLLSMATGTGKTKTAIGALLQLMDEKPSLLVVIVSPQDTISRQWQIELAPLNRFERLIVADGNNHKWPRQLTDVILDLNTTSVTTAVVYTTYNTFSTPKFIQAIARLRSPPLLICDEVHWAGADTFSKGLIENYLYRLGLSATPKRHMDEAGTGVIEQFFEKVVYEFPLERALTEINPATGETFLCPYTYHPIFVSLSADELAEYDALTEQIKRQFAREHNHEHRTPRFQRLCEARQRIIVNAHSKYAAFENLLHKFSRASHILIYCSPEQIDKTQTIVDHQGMVNHRFTGAEGTTEKAEFQGLSERDSILNHFEKGTYRALLAMKCLDEGINVPNARIGVLLASSGNPKQYIQRRGRLLRRCPGKSSVQVFDLIVIPLTAGQKITTLTATERRILEQEVVRYEEFAELATNRMEATNTVFAIKESLGFFRTRRST